MDARASTALDVIGGSAPVSEAPSAPHMHALLEDMQPARGGTASRGRGDEPDEPWVTGEPEGFDVCFQAGLGAGGHAAGPPFRAEVVGEHEGQLLIGVSRVGELEPAIVSTLHLGAFGQPSGAIRQNLPRVRSKDAQHHERRREVPQLNNDSIGPVNEVRYEYP